MTFTPEGLMLGARTVLLAADGAGEVENVQGHEALLLALLAINATWPPPSKSLHFSDLRYDKRCDFGRSSRNRIETGCTLPPS
jgi:hypothetical protein